MQTIYFNSMENEIKLTSDMCKNSSVTILFNKVMAFSIVVQEKRLLIAPLSSMNIGRTSILMFLYKVLYVVLMIENKVIS
jgi:hypothetical protein